MSDRELVDLAKHAEMKAADPNTPPVEVPLWRAIVTDIGEYLAEPTQEDTLL